MFDTSAVPSGVALTSLSLRLKRANGSKVGNPSEDIQAWVLPSGTSFVKADFQRNTVALAGQLSAGNTDTVSFSPEAIDAINAQRAAGDTFIKLRLQAAVLTNNNKNDYMGYFTREQTNTDRHPLLTLSYTTGTSQSTPEVFYALNDHLSTTQAIANAQQTIVWRVDYSPFGVVTVNEDVDGDGKTLAYNLRFPGQYKDEETGQVYNWHRYYDPSSGRYITSDPLGLVDGPNTYVYVGNNPVNLIDPLGLEEEHTTNQRESNRNKHEEGQARKQQDRGGEKGDKNRRVPRKKPKGHKGPWPPRSLLPPIPPCLIDPGLPGCPNYCDINPDALECQPSC